MVYFLLFTIFHPKIIILIWQEQIYHKTNDRVLREEMLFSKIRFLIVFLCKILYILIFIDFSLLFWLNLSFSIFFNQTYIYFITTFSFIPQIIYNYYLVDNYVSNQNYPTPFSTYFYTLNSQVSFSTKMKPKVLLLGLYMIETFNHFFIYLFFNRNNNFLCFEPKKTYYIIKIPIALIELIILGFQTFKSKSFEDIQRNNVKITVKKKARSYFNYFRNIKDLENQNFDLKNSSCSICLISFKPLMERKKSVDIKNKKALKCYPKKFTDDMKIMIKSKLGNTFNKYYISLMETPCKHYFHSRCLVKWMNVKKVCPYCRKRLPLYRRSKIKNY